MARREALKRCKLLSWLTAVTAIALKTGLVATARPGRREEATKKLQATKMSSWRALERFRRTSAGFFFFSTRNPKPGLPPSAIAGWLSTLNLRRGRKRREEATAAEFSRLTFASPWPIELSALSAHVEPPPHGSYTSRWRAARRMPLGTIAELLCKTTMWRCRPVKKKAEASAA